MRAEDLRRHFMRIYPSCSRREIEDLVSAVLSNKYWKVHPEMNDAYYAVALTRAAIPYKDGFIARATFPRRVVVSPRAARFCRRGRILVIRLGRGYPSSETVIDWPAFLRLIRMNGDLVYKLLIEARDPPAFLNRRSLSALCASR